MDLPGGGFLSMFAALAGLIVGYAIGARGLLLFGCTVLGWYLIVQGLILTLGGWRPTTAVRLDRTTRTAAKKSTMNRIDADHLAVCAFLVLPNIPRLVGLIQQRMKEDDRASDRVSPIIGFALLGATVWLLAAATNTRPFELGLWTGLSGGPIWAGLISGSFVLTGHLLSLRFRSRSQPANPTDGYWVLPSLLSPFVEELWRAFTISALISRGGFYAVSTSSIAFAVAHWRSTAVLVSSGVFGLVLALLFIATGSVVAPICAHLVLNVGLLAWRRLQTSPSQMKSVKER